MKEIENYVEANRLEVNIAADENITSLIQSNEMIMIVKHIRSHLKLHH